MANRYNQSASFAGVTRFTKAPMSEVEFSKMVADPDWLLSFNAGEIVPAYYSEVLPHETRTIDLDFVLRQLSASLRPTMGKLQLDLFAFFVPNRVVNESWKNVQGENTSGFWSAPEVDLVPLYQKFGNITAIQIPPGSIADLYGFPTQAPIPVEVLEQCNDLKFRGYLEIYNNYFRDQNYQPPIAYSKLNLYNGFLLPKNTQATVGTVGQTSVLANSPADGSFPDGALVKAIFGEGGTNRSAILMPQYNTKFSALDTPLVANKLHDAFTSVLPSPQKGPEVYFNASGVLPVEFKLLDHVVDWTDNAASSGTRIAFAESKASNQGFHNLHAFSIPALGTSPVFNPYETFDPPQDNDTSFFTGSNIAGDIDIANAIGVSISDLRTAIATQQVYEQLARGGSRYWSFLKSFFGVEVDDPFPDIPTQIGHMRRDLDYYQVAQTSASVSGESPQGSLTAFGYSTNGGAMFTKTFVEHGYIHILAVVRHRNVYSTYFAPDNFRRRTMDFYLPQFANISEQPIRTAVLNPFKANSMETALGYQEAWWEYRYEPDRVHGLMRSGVSGSLDVWHFADNYDPNFSFVDGNWLLSNTKDVLDRTLAIDSSEAPQFISRFSFKVTKQLPMPTYSVPGLDTI